MLSSVLEANVSYFPTQSDQAWQLWEKLQTVSQQNQCAGATRGEQSRCAELVGPKSTFCCLPCQSYASIFFLVIITNTFLQIIP